MLTTTFSTEPKRKELPVADKQALAIRDALRMLSPGPVTLVTTMYRDQPNIMTAAWLMPLSLNPVKIALAVHPTRLTHEFISKTEMFTVNIPNLELLGAVHLCGMKSGHDTDKFDQTKLTPAEATEVEAPYIEECVGHIECIVEERLTLGDHDLFVGQVQAVSAVAEAFNTFWDVSTDAGRLLHHLGADRYAGLSRAYQGKLPDED
jgi:flavin reductase (DIM6/NTAB) family NADH-FMN oxidoreductase RutF